MFLACSIHRLAIYARATAGGLASCCVAAISSIGELAASIAGFPRSLTIVSSAVCLAVSDGPAPVGVATWWS
jgi:hypothetical protein|eukprot:COSAG06_NODE_2397_length_6957_cov_2.660542_2_plen_72_part_00